MFNFRFSYNKMSDAKYLVLERLYSMIDSKAFREYSRKRFEQQEKAAKEASGQLNNQFKVALERKIKPVNPNESKPKLSLKKQKANGVDNV